MDIYYKERSKRMKNDNSTPMAAKEYDEKINNTIPFMMMLKGKEKVAPIDEKLLEYWN